MKHVKFIAVLSAVLMLSAAVYAGGKKEAAKPAEPAKKTLEDIIPKETVTLQVFSQLANYSGLQTGWFRDVMLEKFNVELNIIPDTDGIYETRMESGNLGDLVVWGNDTDEYQAAVSQGKLFDWESEDLLANWGPYIKENMPLALQKNKDISGGKLYGFGFGVSPNFKDRQEFFYTWDFRFDLYEKLGKPVINDLNDVVTLLEKMHEICPTDDNGNPTYGMSLFDDWDGNMVMFVKALATAYRGYDEFHIGLYDPTTGKFHGCLEPNGPYFEALKFFNTLYQKGLLDPDSQTQKYNGMTEDAQNGTVFFNIFNWMASGTYNSDAHTAAGKGMFPILPKKATPIAYGQNVFGGNRVWTIGADTEYPELCMAILNWFSTPEGFMTTEYGPEGANWYIKDGKSYFTEQGKKCKLDPETPMAAPYKGTFKDGTFNINNLTWSRDATNPVTNEPYLYTKWASEKLPARSEIEQHWRDWSKATTPDEYIGMNKYLLAPGTRYTDTSKSDELTVKWNQVTNCIKNYTWKAIYAKTNAEYDSILKTMLEEAKSYGYDECVAFSEKDALRRAAAEEEVRNMK